MALRPARFFWVATITSLIGVAVFIINSIIIGSIPFFASSENTSAYLENYTKFHIFVVASLTSGGLSFLCLKRFSFSLFKRIVLWSNVVVLVFVIPILIVSRGTFVSIALILTASIYLTSKRKLWLLISCIVVILGIYQLGSSLRNYSDDTLNDYFQPREIKF